jgi:hypothetical protein
MLPTVAPGQNYGSAPYRQLCPAYPFADYISTNPVSMSALVKGERQRRNVSARKISGTLQQLKYTSPEMHFSTALPQASALISRNSRHTASLDELAELNNYSK